MLYPVTFKTLPVDQQGEITRARNAYGDEGEDNGVSIGVGGLAAGTAAQTGLNGYVYGSNRVPIRGRVQVTFGSLVSGQNLALNVGHEGSHVADKRTAVAVWAATGDYNQARSGALNITGYDSERRAYYVSTYIAAHQNRESLTMGRGRDTIWTRGMQAVDVQALDRLIRTNYTSAQLTDRVLP